MEDKQDKKCVDVREVSKISVGRCITSERKFYCYAVNEALCVSQYTQVTYITCY